MAVGAGSNAAKLGFGALAAGAIGLGVVLLVPPNKTDPTPDATDATALVSDTAEIVEPEVVPDQVAETPEAPVIMAPTREEFLMFPDGFATLAGKTTPGAEVDVLLDGVSLERVVADAQGNFGATLFIEPSDQPRVMRLVADPTGEAIASPETYFVQPTLVVAEVEAEPVEADVDLDLDVATTAFDALGGDVVADGGDVVVADSGTDVVADDGDVPAGAISDEPVADVVTNAVEPVADAVEEVVSDAVAAAAETVEVIEAVEPAQDTVAEIAPEATPVEEQVASNDTDEPVISEPENTAEVQPEATVDVQPETTTESQPEQQVEEAVVAEAPATEPVDPIAPSSPAVLVADADGVRVLQPAISDQSPEVMSNVALDTITYDDAGEVLIAGRASGEGFVQVYLDNQPITTTLISEQGDWRTDLPDVDTGVYTLRIDEVSAEGDVLSRIETPFQREEAETVAAVFAEDTAEESFEVAVRTVQPGSTLWAIAREQFGSGVMYVAVFEANRDLIRDPDLIYPGQVFRIPEISE